MIGFLYVYAELPLYISYVFNELYVYNIDMQIYIIIFVS